MKRFGFSLRIEVITFKEVFIKAKKTLFNFLKNNRGFSLPEVLIAAGILGGVAVGMMALMKQQTDQSIDGKIQADLAQAKAEIIAAISTPTHCNANFYSKTISSFTTMSAINLCNGSSCGTGGGTAIPKISTVSASGSPEVWTGTGISDRVKLVSITPSIVPTTAVSPAKALTTLNLDLVFRHKQTGNRAPKNLPPMRLTTVVVANTTTILGCPKSWNSTVVY